MYVCDRYMLLEQAREWGRRCMVNGFEQKSRATAHARGAKSVKTSITGIFNFLDELDYLPIRENEARYHKAWGCKNVMTSHAHRYSSTKPICTNRNYP